MKHLSKKSIAKAKKIIQLEKQIHYGEIDKEEGLEKITKLTNEIPLEELAFLDEYIVSKLNEKI